MDCLRKSCIEIPPGVLPQIRLQHPPDKISPDFFLENPSGITSKIHPKILQKISQNFPSHVYRDSFGNFFNNSSSNTLRIFFLKDSYRYSVIALKIYLELLQMSTGNSLRHFTYLFINLSRCSFIRFFRHFYKKYSWGF